MNKETIAFGDIQIEKHKFPYSKYPMNININIDKIISGKVSVSKNCFKYFFDYKDYGKVKPLCIMLPNMNEHTTKF